MSNSVATSGSSSIQNDAIGNAGRMVDTTGRMAGVQFISERLPEFDAERSRLIDEQPGATGRFSRNRTAIAQVGDLVGKVLANQCHLERSPVEADVRIDEPI